MIEHKRVRATTRTRDGLAKVQAALAAGHRVLSRNRVRRGSGGWFEIDSIREEIVEYEGESYRMWYATPRYYRGGQPSIDVATCEWKERTQ